MTERLERIVCGACDLYCGLLAHVDVAKNQVVKITANPDHPLMPNSICRIGMRGMDFVSQPDRLLHPRRRVGERGSGAWEEVGWEEALDDIAARLRLIVEEGGPEAVSSSIGAGGPMPHDMSRRFMNLLGSPNWTSPLLMCAGNTACVNRGQRLHRAAADHGVAERFFRTFKEQIIHGRVYPTVAELRAAVEEFVDLYNEQWVPEKNGFLRPSATRAA